MSAGNSQNIAGLKYLYLKSDILAVTASKQRADLTNPTIALAKGCSEPLSDAAKQAKRRQKDMLWVIMPK
jgi:hypothetical protein